MINLKNCFFFILLLLTFITSCRKDEPLVTIKPITADSLVGDKSILIGEWKWEYTVRRYNGCQQCCLAYDTIYPTTINHTIKMEENGIITYYENNVLTRKNKIKFEHFVQQNNYYSYNFYGNGVDTNRFAGSVFDDSLFSYDFPKITIDSPCEEYKNYFFKQ